LGNLHTSHNKKHEYQIFEAVDLITIILGGTAFVGIFVVGDELIDAWIGSDWLIAQPFSLLMGLELYTLSIRLMLSKYRTTMGLFQQAKYRPVAGMIINLIVSISLVNYWGICGVLVGTIVADWTTYMWYDPMIIHKHGFGADFPVMRYYIKNIKYLVIVALVGAVDWMICRHFVAGFGWISVVVHAAICGITVPAALVGISIRTPEGQYVYQLGMKYVRKITKKL
jgi:O-antigen/teichoic acid export membrane protein